MKRTHTTFIFGALFLVVIIFGGASPADAIVCNDIVLGTQRWKGCNEAQALSGRLYTSPEVVNGVAGGTGSYTLPRLLPLQQWYPGVNANSCDASGLPYGALYNYYGSTAVCPAGYRLPTRADWERAKTAAGGTFAALQTRLKLPNTGYRETFNPSWFTGKDSFGIYATKYSSGGTVGANKIYPTEPWRWVWLIDFPKVGSGAQWFAGVGAGWEETSYRAVRCIASTPTPPASSPVDRCVVNKPPIASIVTPTTNISVQQGQSVFFSGSGSDVEDGATMAAYEWREGVCGTGPRFNSFFAPTLNRSWFNLSTPMEDTRTIYLRVQDSQGVWSTNCPYRIVTVTTPQPDLRAGPIYTSPPAASIVVNEATFLYSRISNSGSEDVLGIFNNIFQFSSNGTDAGAQPPLAGLAINGVPGGSYKETRYVWTPPAPGTYYVRACADNNTAWVGSVFEGANEGNNCSAWTPVVVTGGGPMVPSSTLKICRNSCMSNIQRTTFSLDQNASENLVACYNTAPNCNALDNAGNVTLTSTWVESGTDVVTLSNQTVASLATKRFQAGIPTGTETITVTHGTEPAIILNAIVSCTPTNTCTADPQYNQVCSGASYTIDNGCGGTITCTGNRYCDYNWREVAP